MPGFGSVARMGMLMRIVILSAIVLFFAGTAQAQLLGGSINTGGSSINHATTLNTNVSSSTTTSESSTATSDLVVNRNSKNPGEFVPSQFSTYQDVLAEAKLEAALRPTTVAASALNATQGDTLILYGQPDPVPLRRPGGRPGQRPRRLRDRRLQPRRPLREPGGGPAINNAPGRSTTSS